MRNVFAFVQISVREELQLQKNRIVIEAYKTKITLVERRLVEPVFLGEGQSVVLHAPPEKIDEFVVLSEFFLLRRNAYLVVDIKGCDQDHEQSVLCSDEPAGVKELRELLLRPVLGGCAKAKPRRNAHVQEVEQVVEL